MLPGLRIYPQSEDFLSLKILKDLCRVFVFTGLDYRTGQLVWTTGLTLELIFQLFWLSIKKNAVVLLAKLNLGVWVSS